MLYLHSRCETSVRRCWRSSWRRCPPPTSRNTSFNNFTKEAAYILWFFTAPQLKSFLRIFSFWISNFYLDYFRYYLEVQDVVNKLIPDSMAKDIEKAAQVRIVILWLGCMCIQIHWIWIRNLNFGPILIQFWSGSRVKISTLKEKLRNTYREPVFFTK